MLYLMYTTLVYTKSVILVNLLKIDVWHLLKRFYFHITKSVVINLNSQISK